MKTRTIIVWAGILIVNIWLLSSCSKWRENRETTSEEDNALAENVFDDVFNQVDETIKTNGLYDGKKFAMPGNQGFRGDTINIIITPLEQDSFPKTITIDFGNGFTNDNITRSGKIITTITDYYRNTGCVITTTTDNYYVNGHKVEGAKTVINKGRNSSNNLYYEISVDGKVITSTGDIVTWSSDRVREWVAGENTTGFFGLWDDVYLITGSGSGVNREGKTFEVEIKKALRVKLNCHWVTEGTLEIRPQGLKTRTVDYGDGNCDKNITVTVGNKTYNIQYH